MLFNNFKILFIFLFVLLFYSACTKYTETVFEKNVDISHAEWLQDSILYINFPIEDTSDYYTIFINIRNNKDYKYMNLWLFTSLISPDNKVLKDTVECLLADNRGKWLGAKYGGTYGNQVPFKSHVRFPQKGIYSLQFCQGMREEDKVLRDITQIGITIEKIKFEKRVKNGQE